MKNLLMLLAIGYWIVLAWGLRKFWKYAQAKRAVLLADASALHKARESASLDLAFVKEASWLEILIALAASVLGVLVAASFYVDF